MGEEMVKTAAPITRGDALQRASEGWALRIQGRTWHQTAGETRLDENGVAPRLDAGSARAAAEKFLACDPDPRTARLRLVDVSIGDGRSATVTLETVWHPPMLTAFLPGGATIDVTSTARSVFR